MQRRTLTTSFTTLALAASLMFAVSATLAQTKWDLPAAYPASNFHTENLTQFAKDIDTATVGHPDMA
jgi:TRAP-type C4-dicarboxylate transport system substrate-binding protein